MCKPMSTPEYYGLVWQELPTLLFLPLTQGKFTVIDAADSRFSMLKWSCQGDGYAGRRGGVRLHREILGLTDRKVNVDHRNRIRTDNRRCNLREATHLQNLFNRRGRTACGFKGVGSKNGKYVSRINGKWIGCCATAEEAARLYDLHAVKHFGEFSYLNFPERRDEYETELSQQKQTA